MSNIKSVSIKFEDGSETIVEPTKGEQVQGTSLQDLQVAETTSTPVKAPVVAEIAPEAEVVAEPVAEAPVEVTSPTE